MPARIKWDGLRELRAALLQLPADLVDEAEGIVYDAADAARDDIYAAYPARTGNLRNGLQIQTLQTGGYFKVGSKALGAGAILYNRSKHAYIFEHGTQARNTDLGANRGAMPAGNVFIPRVIRHRRQMYQRLIAMLESHGIVVRVAA